jgi:hypothetical protein
MKKNLNLFLSLTRSNPVASVFSDSEFEPNKGNVLLKHSNFEAGYQMLFIKTWQNEIRTRGNLD